MSHGYYVLDAVKDYETRCSEFSDKCANVLNGEAKAYYTRHKITDAFWLLAAFYKTGDAYLDCIIWRGSYRGKTQGKRVGKMPLADAVIAFPELKKANWLDHWPELENT
jgi:hypothetical protein